MPDARSRTARATRAVTDRNAAAALEPRPPHGLRVARLLVGDEELAVFDWPTDVSLPQSLTRAEQHVVELARRGFSNLQIAGARGTSLRTVANQLAAAYRKLGVGSRLELFVLAGGRGPR